MLFCVLQRKIQQHYLNIPKFMKQLNRGALKEIVHDYSALFGNFAVKSMQFLN